MTEYQRITLKESGEEFVVCAREYALRSPEGTFYIKFVVYDEVFSRAGIITNRPRCFLTVQPQDILKREQEWSQEVEDELVEAAEEAEERDTMMRAMYQKAAEEKMEQRAALLTTQEAEGGDHEGLFG